MKSQATKHAKPSRIRFLKAYYLTANILTRYFFLYFFTKLFGTKRLLNYRSKVHRKSAQQIKKAILDLKGLFIKVGQMLSIMTNFLPETYTKELEGLQDAVPPTPYEEIEKRILEELKSPPTEHFSKFNPDPIASASLGQVHMAWSQEGEKLAVKVQHPHIEEIVRMDLKTLKRIFGFLNLLFPQYRLKKAYQEICEVVLDELDFSNEGKNLERIAQNLSEQKNILIPKVYWEHSTSRILSLEFMEGFKIRDREKMLEEGLQPREVAEKIIHAYCKMIFIDGIYHADPHPGNFLVQTIEEEVEVFESDEEDTENTALGVFKKQKVPHIVMMDFGAVAQISEPMRQGIAKFMDGIIKRDNQVISQAMKDMGFIAKTENEEVFDKIVEFFYERLKDIDLQELRNFNIAQFEHIENVFEFRKLDISIKELLQTFSIPKEWALLERTLILLVGLTTHLDPNLNPLTIIVPYAEKFVLGQDRTFADFLVEAVKEIALGYLKLPGELQRTLRRLNQGEIQFQHSQQNSAILRHALNRLSYTLLTFGSLAVGYVLQKDGVRYFETAYYMSGFFGFLFGLSLLRKK